MDNFKVTDPEGNIYSVTGLAKFAIDHDLNFECLRQVAVGRMLHHRGWKSEYIDPVKKAIAFEKTKERVAKRGWVIFNPEGKKLLTLNLRKFCRKNNLSYYNMRQSAISFNAYNGWRCFYADKEKRKLHKKISNRWQIIRKGVTYNVNNLTEFCITHNLSYYLLKHNRLDGWECKRTRVLKLRTISKLQ
jgi:hypothetical protein